MSDTFLGEQAKTQGNEAFLKKDFLSALKLYSRACFLDPYNAGYFCNRSAARLALKNEDWAVEDGLMASRLDRTTSKRFSRLGNALAACGRRREAKEAFETSLRLGKNNVAAQTGLDELQKLDPVEHLTAAQLTESLDQLIPKQHGLAQVEQLARRVEASGMVCQKEPTSAEALVFVCLALHAERKYYTPKPVDEFFPLLACRAVHVLNRSPRFLLLECLCNSTFPSHYFVLVSL
jgi:tetratricopeptide (TPR) repeat protein